MITHTARMMRQNSSRAMANSLRMRPRPSPVIRQFTHSKAQKVPRAAPLPRTCSLPKNNNNNNNNFRSFSTLTPSRTTPSVCSTPKRISTVTLNARSSFASTQLGTMGLQKRFTSTLGPLSGGNYEDYETISIADIPYVENPSLRCTPPRHKRKTTVLFPNIPIRVMKAGVKEHPTKAGTFKLAVIRTECKQGKKDLEKYLESLYGLKIRKINTLNYDAKIKRLIVNRGRKLIYRKKGSAYKKAYVTFLDPVYSPKKFYETYSRNKWQVSPSFIWRGTQTAQSSAIVSAN